MFKRLKFQQIKIIFRMNYFPINSKYFKKSILLIFLILPFIQFAQTEMQKDSVEVIPQAIEISEIANYSEGTRILIEETQELINNKAEVKSINERLIKLDSMMEPKLVLLRDSLSYFTFASFIVKKCSSSS